MSLPRMYGTFRAVNDPTLRFSQNGMAICSVTAVADKKKNDGTRENPNWVDDKVIFVRITCFKELAEHVAASVVKGTNLIVVDGETSISEWTTQEGEKRTTVEVLVNDLGVGLRWDTATVHKAERGQGNQGGAAQARPVADNPWSTAPGNEEPPF